MAPYRSQRQTQPAEPAREGMVADMVRQFADPYAFLRELVQNGVDAGATSITVRLDYDSDGAVRTSVSDDGCGMTRAIIEGPLLTLFSSSKENDSTKIGKYGVGFVSVFAIEPIDVEVVTWRAGPEGAWRLLLRPDHSYELAHAEPRPKSGTVVSLSHRMDAPEFSTHVAAARTALLRWCRHVRCPTELVVRGLHGEQAHQTERIDRPLAVRSIASLVVEVAELELTLAIGCAVNPEGADPLDMDPELSQRFAGFYNRGLTLYESSSAQLPGLDGVRFKADSAWLAHTLSRDDVRRDRAFAAVLSRARAVVEEKLRPHVARRLRELAAGVAAGGADASYLELLSAAARPPLSLPNDALAAPLTDPVRGKNTMSFDAVVHRSDPEPLCATAPSALTAALGRAGKPVVRLTPEVVAARIGKVSLAHADWTLIEELCALPDDHPEAALLAAVASALAAVEVPVARVGRCSCVGAPTLGAVLVPAASSGRRARDDGSHAGASASEESPSEQVARRHLLHATEVTERRRWWDPSSALLVDIRQEPWLSAISGKAHVATRGQLLARALLITAHGVLSAVQNDRLLASCVAEPS